MSTLTERVRAAIQEAGAESTGAEYGFVPIVRDEQAEAAIREVLAYLPEASVQAVYQAIGSTIMANGPEGEFRQLVGLFVRAVAREHGLDPPPAEEQQP